MQPTITNLDQIKLVGISKTLNSMLTAESNSYVEIPRLWIQFIEKKNDIQHRSSTVSTGYCLHTDSNHINYLAAVEVKEFNDLPEGLITQTIPGGKHAVFTHFGKLDHLKKTINYIYTKGLPQAGLRQRAEYHLEVYDHRFNPALDTSEFTIYIPIE